MTPEAMAAHVAAALPKANIRKTKDDATIARELRRRVILPGIRVMQQIRARQAADDAAEARRLDNMRRIAHAIGLDYSPGSRCDRHMLRASSFVETLGPRKHYTRIEQIAVHGCRLTIDLDIDTAIRVIALLKGQ